jgi:hypothetical protein
VTDQFTSPLAIAGAEQNMATVAMPADTKARYFFMMFLPLLMVNRLYAFPHSD